LQAKIPVNSGRAALATTYPQLFVPGRRASIVQHPPGALQVPYSQLLCARGGGDGCAPGGGVMVVRPGGGGDGILVYECRR
jgi:hypothetical protein